MKYKKKKLKIIEQVIFLEKIKLKKPLKNIQKTLLYP
jgi:hypothetical protein